MPTAQTALPSLYGLADHQLPWPPELNPQHRAALEMLLAAIHAAGPALELIEETYSDTIGQSRDLTWNATWALGRRPGPADETTMPPELPQSAALDKPSTFGRATIAHCIYQSLMDLGEQALAAENAAGTQAALWDALGQSLDAAAALASSLRDLEKIASLKGLDV